MAETIGVQLKLNLLESVAKGAKGNGIQKVYCVTFCMPLPVATPVRLPLAVSCVGIAIFQTRVAFLNPGFRFAVLHKSKPGSDLAIL